jgi:hypothetical protein
MQIKKKIKIFYLTYIKLFFFKLTKNGGTGIINNK